MPYWCDEIGTAIFEAMQASDALLLGRKTYQGFAAAFASAPTGDPFVDHMNNTPKYVVSTTLDRAAWQNSTLINSNVVAELRKLNQQPGRDISVSDSSRLVHTLIQNDLVDVYRRLVYPVVLGSGKRLFPNGVATKLMLVESKMFPTGVVLLHYVSETKQAAAQRLHRRQPRPAYQANTRSARSVFHRLGRPSPSSSSTGIVPGCW